MNKFNISKSLFRSLTISVALVMVLGTVALIANADSSRPSAPQNLQYSSLASSSVTLSWTASTDNVAVKGYNVYRNGKRIAAAINKLTYTATELTAQKSYYFVVKAVDAAGNISLSSNRLNFSTPAVDTGGGGGGGGGTDTGGTGGGGGTGGTGGGGGTDTGGGTGGGDTGGGGGTVTPVAATYKTNPTFGKQASGTVTIDGANNGEWSDSNLIASGLANDDPRTLGNNWTLHEAPMDMTHLWAQWDATNLYLAWQYVDVTDVIDPANAGSAGGGAIAGQNLIQSIAIDTTSGQGSPTDMWNKNVKKPFWTGDDVPDYHIYVASNFWQGYISKAVSGKFPVDDGGINYFTIKAAGIQGAVGRTFAASTMPGVMDADDRKTASKVVDFLTKGHDKKRDSFYELKIPLSAIGNPDLTGKGIGVFLHQGEVSALNTMPHDEAALDSPGVETWNSSLEWADSDAFTVPFARIGKAK